MAGIEDLGNFDIRGTVDAVSGGAYTIVMVVLSIAILGAILFGIFYYLQYKHRVILKVMTQQGSYQVEDKAREITENGVKFWYLFKRREVVTVPPPESVNMTKGGKFVATAYFSEETGLVWATDTITRETLKQKVLHDSVGSGKMVKDSMQPFTTQERALMANRIERAMLRKKKNLLDVISQLATPIALVVMFICVLVFWEDIAKPAQEMGQYNVQISKQNAEISAQNARIISALRPDLNIPVSQTIGDGGAP